MAEENETFESLKLKLKQAEEKNQELTNKLNELNVFIEKQNTHIQKLREELNNKELIILQQQKNGIEKEDNNVNKEKTSKIPKTPKTPKTPLSIKTSFPNQGKISYFYSKIASPTVDGSYTTLSPIFHVDHSSTDDEATNKNLIHGRKFSHSSQLAKETTYRSENNISLKNAESNDSINNHIKSSTEENDSVMNSSINNFEDKEIFSDQITVSIQKLEFCKNDRNKKDVSFIISVWNADNGTELWRIRKSYTNIQNLENIIKTNYPKEQIQNIGKLPERNLNSLKIENKRIQLKLAMEMYLQHLCNEYRNSIEVAEFLSKDIIATINNRENDEKGSCIKSGYLFKKNNFMGWRTKYFILNEKDISFYESKGGDLNGTINLKHAKVISVSNKEKFHHAFRIIEYKDEKGVIAKTAEDKIYAKHLLCSENDNDRDEWVTKIKSVIDKLKRENEGVASLMNSNNNVLSKSNNNSFDVNKSHDSSINEINKEQYIESKDTIKEGAETHNDDNKELENKINDNNELENKINDNSNNNENENDNNENINNENNNENGNGNNNNRNNEDSGDNNIESPSSNNNGWDSSDEEEDVDIILDYDEKNYIPEGFNFEEFEKQGIDINEYIKNKSRKNSNENNNEDDGKKVNDDTNDHNNEDENYNENNENNEYTENENPKSDVIDDNERVMKQTIPPPLVPKSTVAYERNEKLKVGKEEKQRKIHFSWYKFKKNTNSVNDIDNKDLDKNKKVFGVNLETAIKNSKIKDDYELPAIVYRCIEYLDAKGAYEEEGIYRLSGSKATIQSLKNRFDRYGDVNLLQDKEIYDVHVITGLLKLYLRELPTTIMTKEFQPRFIEIASIPDREEKVVALANLISYLPLANYTLLRCLAAHLVRIVQNSELNKMTLSNIAIVFGPTLGIPIGLFVLILSEFEAVFCWTTLKESEEEENIMSILFSGPEDYLNVHSVSKAQKDARNKLQLQNKMEHSSPVLFNENQQNEKDVDQSLRDTDNHSSENSDSEVPEITSDDLITGSFKVRGRSNTNVQKNNNYKNIQAIKEESTTRDQLSLSEEVVNLINEKCKNINMESDKEKLETILDAENLQNEFRRRRKERCSSLFVSSQSQIDYVKSLRRLSCGESSIKEVINRNSQDYMIGIPDNFRLSEMFAKEIKIKDNEEIINSKNVEYDHALAQ